MGCCELELEEMTLYQTANRVKNQYRKGDFSDRVRCYRCNAILEHEFVKRNLLGFTIRIKCLQCGLEFQG